MWNSWFYARLTRTSLRRLKAGLSALVHRGPDQQGHYSSKNVSLGATRLSIIDLAGGDQPIHIDDLDATIAFNGEIYNHIDLRAELKSLGRSFQTHCDTEVVLNAFLEWGPSASRDCAACLPWPSGWNLKAA